MQFIALIEYIASKATFDFISYLGITIIIIQLKVFQSRMDKQDVLVNLLGTRLRKLEKGESHG